MEMPRVSVMCVGDAFHFAGIKVAHENNIRPRRKIYKSKTYSTVHSTQKVSLNGVSLNRMLTSNYPSDLNEYDITISYIHGDTVQCSWVINNTYGTAEGNARHAEGWVQRRTS